MVLSRGSRDLPSHDQLTKRLFKNGVIAAKPSAGCWWYNTEHHHSGIALLTPEQVHYGLANEVIGRREVVLAAAFEKNPSRFKHKIPAPAKLPEAVWINPPATQNMQA